MKKIIDDLIKEIPELKKDKAKLEKFIGVLCEVKNKIQPSEAFKINLKNRLLSITHYSEEKKVSSFSLKMLLPLFSMSFVFFGLYYFLGDGVFKEHKIMDTPENIEIRSMKIDPLQMDEPQIESSQIEPFQIEVESIETHELDMGIPSSSRMMKMSGESNIENDEILQELDSLGELFDNEINSMESDNSINDDGTASMMMDSFMMPEMSFENFCENEFGTIAGEGENMKCIKDTNECWIHDYISGTCEFKEINKK